jgi:hypothetical protein
MLQYTTGRDGGGHQDGVLVPFFDGAIFHKNMRRCTGCTVSKLTLPAIANSTHTSVNPKEDFYAYVQPASISVEDSIRNAESFFQELKDHHKGCKFNEKRCQGGFTLRQFTTVRGDGSWFIGCTNWKREEKGHRCVPIKNNVDIDVLRRLINNYDARDEEIDLDMIDWDSAEVEYCHTVLRNCGGNRGRCDHTHRVGGSVLRPELISKVIFIFFIFLLY